MFKTVKNIVVRFNKSNDKAQAVRTTLYGWNRFASGARLSLCFTFPQISIQNTLLKLINQNKNFWVLFYMGPQSFAVDGFKSIQCQTQFDNLSMKS